MAGSKNRPAKNEDYGRLEKRPTKGKWSKKAGAKEEGMQGGTNDDDENEHALGSVCYVMVTGWFYAEDFWLKVESGWRSGRQDYLRPGLDSALSILIVILLIADWPLN